MSSTIPYNRLIGGVSALALLMSAGSALAEASMQSAQGDGVTEVTVTATRYAVNVAEAPATVSVITAKQIEDNMATDIKDLVRYEPGVSVRNAPARFSAAGSTTGRDGNAGFNIRGLEGNRVLIQVDGIRVPDGYAFGGQNVGRGDYVGLNLIKSVEILRGPSSALYGSDGVAGAVSFVTKDPADFLSEGRNFGGEASVSHAQADESTGGGVVLAGRAGSLSGYVSYAKRSGEAQKTKGTVGGVGSSRTQPVPLDNDSESVLTKLVWEPAEGHTLRFTYETSESEMTADLLTAVSASTNSLYAHDTLDRNRTSLDYRFEGEGFIKFGQIAVYHQDSHSYQFSDEDRTVLADRTRINIFDTEVYGLSAQARSEFGNHTLVYGLDHSVTTQSNVRDGTVPPMGETYPSRAFPTTDYTLTGLFVQDEIRLFNDRVSMFPALRFDSYKLDPKNDAPGLTPSAQDGSHLSPKLAFVWRYSPSVNVVLNWAEGYKAPSPGQVNNAFSNLVSNYTSLPNPDLKPETSRTTELGVRFTQPDWNFAATVFTGKYSDFIEQAFVGGSFTATDPARYQFINYSDVEISGWEARGHVKLSGGFRLDAAASYTKGESHVAGVKTPLQSIDPVKVVAGLSYRAQGGRYGGQLHAVHSARKAVKDSGFSCSVAGVSSPANCYYPASFTVFDLTGFWRLNDTVTLRGGIFNLTDETYTWWSDVRGLSGAVDYKDAYTQPGRNVSVSLNAKF